MEMFFKVLAWAVLAERKRSGRHFIDNMNYANTFRTSYGTQTLTNRRTCG